MAVNPKSLNNLKSDGRPPAFSEPKKKRELTVTQTGWAGAKAIAKQLGCSGVSELLEKIGRGEIVCSAEELPHK